MPTDDETTELVATLRLTENQRQVLLRACRKYRTTLPAYLQIHKPELEALDALVKQLSEVD